MISLSDEDRTRAIDEAHQRGLPKREFGVPTQKRDSGRSDLQIDYYGLLAEIAVEKVLGARHNTHTKLSGDEGHDLTWRDERCEVKFTFYPHGHLLTKGKENVVADRFILVSGDDKNMTLLGWTDRDTFLKRGEMKDFGHGLGFAMAGKDLRSMNEFDPLQKRLLELLEPNGGDTYGQRKGIESAEAV